MRMTRAPGVEASIEYTAILRVRWNPKKALNKQPTDFIALSPLEATVIRTVLK
jgi:hypothetical protein